MKKIFLNKYNLLTFFAILFIYPIEIINANMTFMFRTSFKLLFSFLFILIYIKTIIYERKINLVILLFSILSVFTVLITMYNKGNIFHSIYYDLLLYNVILIIIYLNFKYNYDYFWIILNSIFGIYIYIIFICYILNIAFGTNLIPLSNYNDNFNFYFIFLVSSLFIIYNKCSIKYIIFLFLTVLLMIIECVYNHSLTTLISIILFSVLFVVKYYEKIINILIIIFNPYLVILYNFVFFVSVVLVNIYGKLGNIIGILFNKSDSFGQRIYIWHEAISRISKNPIGYGIQFFNDKQIHIEKVKHIFMAFHNIYLETTYETGLIGILLFIVIIVFVTVHIYLVKDKIIKLSLSIILFILLFRFQIASEFKNCFSSTILLLYLISERFEKKELSLNVKNYFNNPFNYITICSLFILIPINGIYLLVPKLLILALELIVFILNFLIFVKLNKKNEQSKICLFWILYFLISIIIIINTYVKNGMLITAFHNQFFTCNVIILVIYNSLSINKRMFFNNTYILYFIYIVIHLCLNYYIFNSGYNVYLFDNPNYHWHEYIVLFISFIFLYFIFEIKNNKFLNYTFIFSLIVILDDCLIRNYSLTTLLTLVSVLFLVYLIDKNDLSKKVLYKIFNPFLILLYNIVIWFMLIYQNVDSLVFKVISNIFNKGLSSSERMLIWKKGIDLISNNVMGYGIQDKNSSIYKIFINETRGFLTFHNIYLEFIYDGGIAVIFLLICLLLLVCYHMNKIQNKKHRLIYSIILFFTLIRYQVETGVKTVFIFIITIIYFMSIFQYEKN